MKKLLSILLLIITAPTYGQKYETYVGAVISEDKEMHSNYMIGFNRIIDLKLGDEYLNKLIVGFENSAYMSNNKTLEINSQPNSIENACGCDSESLNLNNPQTLDFKKEVRAVSLNLGLEFCTTCWLKRLYLMTGITSSKHITKINGSVIDNNNYTTHVDAGLKYFAKVNNWYIVPTIKFNPETVSFGLGAGF